VRAVHQGSTAVQYIAEGAVQQHQQSGGQPPAGVQVCGQAHTHVALPWYCIHDVHAVQRHKQTCKGLATCAAEAPSTPHACKPLSQSPRATPPPSHTPGVLPTGMPLLVASGTLTLL
jgi:hypothetical protein